MLHKLNGLHFALFYTSVSVSLFVLCEHALTVTWQFAQVQDTVFLVYQSSIFWSPHKKISRDFHVEQKIYALLCKKSFPEFCSKNNDITFFAKNVWKTILDHENLQNFVFLNFWGTHVHCCGVTDTPVLGLMMRSPLGFKARLGSLYLHLAEGYIPKIHLWCDHFWQPAWQPVTFPTCAFQQRQDARFRSGDLPHSSLKKNLQNFGLTNLACFPGEKCAEQ